MENKNIESIIKENIQLKNENQKLLKHIEEKTFNNLLTEVANLIDITSILGSYDEEKCLNLLLSLVENLVNAEVASILLYDKENNDLFFKAATGEKAEQVKKFRLKPYEGIAGYCFSSGRAIAVRDVQKDSRFKADISRSIDMEQKTLLAVPLIFNEEIIGVIEAINKKEDKSFTQQDIDILSIIAELSIYLIYKFDIGKNIYSFILSILKQALLKKELPEISSFNKIIYEESKTLQSDKIKETIKLALTIKNISNMGTEEYELIKSVLSPIEKYLNEKNNKNIILQTNNIAV